MGYLIKLKRSVEKEILKLPRDVIKRIVRAIDELENDPYPRDSKKIRGTERTYRLRVGNYRIIYQVDEERKEIIIYHVRHRKSVYKNKF
ncbi:MAG: type II toxin-antitoxin system RelE/ParE family toxin [Thermoplasmata archaeon]|nr:type II toxin-antitoxin system RelE/ParE family toxin [Thermoplasmata archaeon]